MSHFHTLKDDFVHGWPGKNGTANANALGMKLMKKWKLDKKMNAETWMLLKKQRKMNPRQNYISLQKDVSNKMDANFNFLKIHLMSNWAHQIRQFGALQ